MTRQAIVFVHKKRAGVLEENDSGRYVFTYDENYLANPKSTPVSLTLPLRKEGYTSNVLFPFFDGLIPEGWLFNLAVKNWKLDQHDRMGILLAVCHDCIGNISIENLGCDE